MDSSLSSVVAFAVPHLSAVSEDAAARKPAPDKWSKKEILGHLVDSAANNHQRFVRLQLEHAPDGLPAGQIAEKLQLLPASLSFHLKELSRAGLIGARQDGRFVWYRADLDAMNGLVAYLTENCCKSGAVCVSVCTPTPKRVALPKARPVTARRSS